jgi:hypothetical protein
LVDTVEIGGVNDKVTGLDRPFRLGMKPDTGNQDQARWPRVENILGGNQCVDLDGHGYAGVTGTEAPQAGLGDHLFQEHVVAAVGP